MKKILILLLLNTNLNAQICKSNVLQIDPLNEGKFSQTMAGSCASPDGPDKLIGSPPPSYAWLQANGYCYTITPTQNFTACYTFTSSATTATFNSGYSSTGCAVISFGGFNLYRCAPACTFVGSGLTFSGLTIGQCYTWCFSGTCTGPGPGFTTLCPYYMQTGPLPVEIIFFNANQQYKQNIIEWKTATEINTSYFEVERATDNVIFSSLGTITAAFNSKDVVSYQLVDKQPKNGLNYYRLKQYDVNGSLTIYPVIIVVDNRYGEIKPYKIYNTAGQQVNEDYEGLKIIEYLDGKRIKTY